MFGTTCYVYDDKGNITKKYWREYTTADIVEELKYEITPAKGTYCGSSVCGSSTFARSDFKGLIEYPNTTNYTYDNKGQLVGFGKEEITYDNYGHPVNYLGNALEWTNGKLTKFTKPDGTVITYAYDANGYRTSKTVDGHTTKYYYGHNGHVIQEDFDDCLINYKYDAAGICGFDLVYMDGDIYKTGYFHYVKDLLGNVKYILDNDGNIVVEYNYDAWGKCNAIWHESATVGDRVFTNLQDLNSIRYKGYYYDRETGLYYLINRYYDPEVGRFISIDDANYLDFDSFFGTNRYAYCGNDPINKYDPTGHFPWLILAAAILLFTPVGGTITQGAVSTLGYVAAAGWALGDLVFNEGKGAWADMCSINWNPFNADEDKVMNSNYLSFYKGVPVLQISGMGGSMSLGLIFFDKGQGVEVLKHERGHNTQLMSMGLGNYLIQIGIPSVWKNGEETPWELSASMLGGSALANGYSEEQKREAYNYYIRACFSIINIYNIIKYIFY